MPSWVHPRQLTYLCIFALPLLTSFGWGLPAAASVRYVDVDAAGADDGTSWVNAFTNLQDAFATAQFGDEIWVAEGTYYPTPGLDRTATFQLKSGLGVYGGFSGTEAVREERDWATHATVLSGDIGEPGNYFENDDNSYHVVTGSDTDATGVLDGFTITAGFASTFPDQVDGAGMYIVSGSPSLLNLVFLANHAGRYGGGIYCFMGHPDLDHVEFRGNLGGDSGGGIYFKSSDPVLEAVLLNDNSGHEYGGGICNDASNPTLRNVQFDGNQAYFGGGMANLRGSSPILTDVQFKKNWADDGGGGLINEDGNPILTRVVFVGNGTGTDHGGGVYNLTGNPVLTDVLFDTNLGSQAGGGMWNGGAATLTNVVFKGNYATGVGFGGSRVGGGGLFNAGPSIDLTNVLFDRNLSWESGGGMVNLTGDAVLTNVAFAGNTAGGNGGALACYGGSTVVTNSILWGDQADASGHEIHHDGAVPRISYSLIQGSGGSGPGWDLGSGVDGGNNLDVDPLFLDAASGNLRLSLGSPAVGAGDDAAIPPGVTTDLDGNLRIRGSSVDLGPYEFQTSDDVAPTLSIELSHSYLWPPNHQLVSIQATVSVEDKEDPEPKCVLVSIVSDEPDAGTGPGDRPEDIQGATMGSLDRDFRLRSERMGSGPGRTYTVTYQATDASGNVATAVIPVRVSHDRSGADLAGRGPLPDGVEVHRNAPELAWEAPSLDPTVNLLHSPRGFAVIAPNPFRSATRIAFNLPAPGPVRLEVYDLRGARMRSLVPGTTLPAGLHAWTWDGADDAGRAAPTGMYFLRLAGDGFAETRKLALMR